MSAAPYRCASGGRVDRGRTVTVGFAGREYAAHPGDTLASALLAHGVRRFATGIYTGRPRGVVALGSDEPSAVVQVESDGGEPMVPATVLAAAPGLRAWPLAGRGRLPGDLDTRRQDKRWAHCDVLVVGGGPAGIAAALAAASGGARVVLADEQAELGGGLLADLEAWHRPALAGWVAGAVEELAAAAEVTVLTGTTVVGHHDHRHLVAVQRRGDELGEAAPPYLARRRLWHLRPREVILATGARERPVAFPDNDRPGVMLAGAVAGYAARFGVRAGDRAVVFTAHDAGRRAAAALRAAGVEVAAVVDARAGSAVVGTEAGPDGEVAAALVGSLPSGGRRGTGPDRVPCDLIAVCGGFDPAVELHAQAGGRLTWSAEVAGFVPVADGAPVRLAGAVTGSLQPGAALRTGVEAGLAAAAAAGHPGRAPELPAADVDGLPAADADGLDGKAPMPLFTVASADDDGGRARTFVDLQRDATLVDLARAVGAGLSSAEHVKRYTTVGTAADQGRTSSTLALGCLAGLTGRPVAEMAPTTARPPAVPVSFGLLAGRDRGRLADPVRTTAMHPWHVDHGAVFEDVGQWKRPRFFPRPGEDMAAAVRRECAAARSGVSLMDASTLGKIDLQGPDVGELLDHVYTGRFSTLAVGQARYGVMCTADGMVFDDGVTTRLDEDRWLMTTTTGNAAAVLDWLEEWLQTEWPDLRVYCTSVTEHWATTALVGPRSRDVLARLAPDLDVSAEGFGFMTVKDAVVAGVDARVFRISFSGELAYEVNVPWHLGLAVWEAVVAAGQDLGITPYGTEAMHVLRAEKGYPIVGQDTDGTVTPQDLGMGWAVARRKPHYLGKRSHRRPDTSRPDRRQLVGLLPADPGTVLAEGAQLVATHALTPPVPMTGHVTSSYFSAVLDRGFALALVSAGAGRHGETLYAVDDGVAVPVTVTAPVFYDPQGERRDG